MFKKWLLVNEDTYGDTFKCCSCRGHFHGPYRNDQYFIFCPLCGIRFEGEQVNSLFTEEGVKKHRPRPYDPAEDRIIITMNSREGFLRSVKNNQKEFLVAMEKYRDEIAEYLDEVFEATHHTYVMYCKPPKPPILRSRKSDWRTNQHVRHVRYIYV